MNASVVFSYAPLLDPQGQGAISETWDSSYDTLLDSLMDEERVVTAIGDNMWVPWYKTSSSCTTGDLQSGDACNAHIDDTHNCMVTDEYSQVGVLVSMGKDQAQMDRFYNTLDDIKSRNGVIPAWRIYRNGDAIEPCRPGINGNCDTASDATARIIISLYTGANNDHFPDQGKKDAYEALANQMSYDFLEYEVDKGCRQTRYGEACYWLAAGSEAKRAGFSATDYAYTGYYADAIIAMQMACSQTGDQRFCDAARSFSLNYLQASEFDGNTFSAPPGRSFRWAESASGPVAQCTNTCGPDAWDGADAPRALGICMADYYAGITGKPLPELDRYCDIWEQRYMRDPSRAPIQYYADGTPSTGFQSGYFAQGLQAMFLMGSDSKELYQSALTSALKHYVTSTKTWDYSQCFGVYTQAFAMRGLGSGIGRDMGCFTDEAIPFTPLVNPETPLLVTPENPTGGETIGGVQSSAVANLDPSCDASGCSLIKDTSSGSCRTLEYATSNGPIKVFACDKDGGMVEMYTQQAPTGLQFRVCLTYGCVDQSSGFSRFTPQGDPVPALLTQPTPAEPTLEVPATPQESALAALTLACQAPSCTIQSDSTVGTCRTASFTSDIGTLKVQACDKGEGMAELYRQEAPTGKEFRVCMGAACVDQWKGFQRFEIDAADAPLNRPQPIATIQPIVEPTGIAALSQSCDAAGCALVKDTTSGTCRTLEYTTSGGPLKIMGCVKDGTIEVYRQVTPSLGTYKACLGNGCIDQMKGFALVS